ncbi:MAG TPA: hypothetical protein VF276_07935 [Chloroflexia bacterium]
MATPRFTGKGGAGAALALAGVITDRPGHIGPLYPDVAAYRASELVQRAIRTTGAGVMGRGA